MIKYIKDCLRLMIAVTLVASIIVTTYIAGQESAMEKYGLAVATDSPFPQQLNFMRIVIIACYLIMFVSIYRQFRNTNLTLVISGLIILAGYTWWYYDTMNLIRNSGGINEIGVKNVAEIGYLRTANWWDYLVLIETFIIMICAALNILFLRKRNSPNFSKSLA